MTNTDKTNNTNNTTILNEPFTHPRNNSLESARLSNTLTS